MGFNTTVCVKDRGLHSQKIETIIFLNDSLENSILHMWKFRKNLRLEQRTLAQMSKYGLSCIKTGMWHSHVPGIVVAHYAWTWVS